MRKYLIFTLSIILILCLTACGPTIIKNENPVEFPSSAESVEKFNTGLFSIKLSSGDTVYKYTFAEDESYILYIAETDGSTPSYFIDKTNKTAYKIVNKEFEIDSSVKNFDKYELSEFIATYLTGYETFGNDSFFETSTDTVLEKNCKVYTMYVNRKKIDFTTTYSIDVETGFCLKYTSSSSTGVTSEWIVTELTIGDVDLTEYINKLPK